MWKLKLVEYAATSNPSTLSVGECFYFNQEAYELEKQRPEAYDDASGWYWPNVFAGRKHLSKFYMENNAAKRRPICVWMPGHTLFCVDGMCRDSTGEHGGWTVTGSLDAGDLTVSPSINIGGIYHGYIENACIGPDVDGRIFDPIGRNVKR